MSNIDEKHLIKELQSAMQSKRIYLTYQPILDIKNSNSFHRYEILVRMRGSDGAIYEAKDFIQILERQSFSDKFDQWVITNAFKLMQAQALFKVNVIFFINICKSTMESESFISWLAETMQKYGVTGEHCVLEIPLSHIKDEETMSKNFITHLHELGCKVSIEHYKPGIVPLATLQEIQPDFIKLDSSLALNMEDNPEKGEKLLHNAILEIRETGAISMVTAIENVQVMAVLWQIGVGMIQGHFIQRPEKSLDFDFSLNAF